MIGLLIFLGIILFVVLLLSFSLTVYVTITDNVTFKIGCFGLKREFDLDEENEDKPKIKSKKEKVKNKSKNETEKQKPVKPETFAQTVQTILSLIKAAFEPAKYLLKKVRITSLFINMTVSDDDADKTAIKYGQVSAGIYNLLAHLDNLIKLKIKCVNISPDFVTGQAKYDIAFKVKIRLYVVLFAGIRIFSKFVANTITKSSKNTKKVEKIGV